MTPTFRSYSLFIIALIYGGLNISAQNLVPNGGFEEVTKCPSDYGDFHVSDWLPLGEDNTPDLFSGCAPASSFFNPNSAWVVKPLEGKTYAALVLFPGDENGLSYHEIIYVKLSEPLVQGKVYRLHFQLASPLASLWSCTTINAIFSKPLPVATHDVASLKNTTNLLFDLEPLYPAQGWQVFENDFEAKGGEQYLAIGNFRNTQETKAEQLPNRKEAVYKTTFNMSYVCLDDVQVTEVTKETPGIKKRDPLAKKTPVVNAASGNKPTPPKPAPKQTVTEKVPAKVEAAKPEVKKPTEKPLVEKPTPAKKDTVVPKPVKTEAPKPALKGDEELVLSDLNFTTDSWQLKNSAIPELDPLIGFLKAHAEKHVIITGYTDNKGGKQHNDLLSKKRADSISAYLVKHGVAKDQITARGFGSEMPVAGNDTEAGRKQNRRVELRVQ